MEEERSGCLGSAGAQGGISHSLLSKTPTIHASDILRILRPLLHQGPSSGGGNRNTATNRRSGASPLTGVRVLQPFICGPQSFRGLATNNRSQTIEQIHQEDQVSDGDRPVGPLFNSEERLDGLHRPEGCLPTGSNPTGQQKIPSVRHQRRSFPVPYPMLRPVDSSASFHEGDGSGLYNSPQHGSPSHEIPGRLANPSCVQGRVPSSEGLSNESLFGTRHRDKHREIIPDTIPTNNIPRSDHQLHDFEGFTFDRETDESININRRISFLKNPTCQSLAQTSRSPLVPEPIGPRGQIENEVPATKTAETVGLQEQGKPNILGQTMPTRPPVVEFEQTSAPRLLSTGSSSRPRLLVRRLGRGMGGSSFRPLYIGSMDRQRERDVNKYEGTQGCEVRPPKVPGNSPRQSGSAFLRQYISGSISEEPRRDDITESESRGPRDPQMVRKSRSSPPSTILVGLTECDSRFPIKTKPDTRSRMDPLPRGGRHANKEMASNNRSIRNVTQLSTPSVFRTPPRPNECRNRFLAPKLGQPTGLCLSSLSTYQKSAKQDKTVKEASVDNNNSVLAPEGVVSRLAGVNDGTTPSTTNAERSTQTTSLPQIPSEPPRATSSCVATFQRFAKHEGFSSRVAKQLSLARRRSTNIVYQQKWSTFRNWCRDKGLSVSRPTLPKIADFLLYLRQKRNLSTPSIKGYRSMLSYVFKLRLPEISSSPILKDLIRSFTLGRNKKPHCPPSWDLNEVLKSLMSPPFEPLQEATLRNTTKKALFLLSLASVKRIGEIQSISSRVATRGIHLSLSYLPEFVAKTESESNPIPRYFLIKALSDFAAGLEEGSLLCPVRAIKIYLDKTKHILNRPRNLFVSPRKPSKGISKNALSFFLRETISDANALVEEGGHWPRAHSIRGVGTSMSFWRNWSMSKILEAATWKSNTVFTSYYLKDVEYTLENCSSLGPFIAAGQIIND